MVYVIALVLGVIIVFMGIMGLIARASAILWCLPSVAPGYPLRWVTHCHHINITPTSRKLQKKPLSSIMTLVESLSDESLTWLKTGVRKEAS